MLDAFSKLSIDERDAVADLLDTDGWRPLLKLIAGMCADHERAVISLSADNGSEPIMRAKLKAEGARKLEADIAALPNKIRKLSK